MLTSDGGSDSFINLELSSSLRSLVLRLVPLYKRLNYLQAAASGAVLQNSRNML
jgi:hypothetical protein